MARPTTIEIKKDVTMDELNKLIRSLKKSVRMLKKLYFVKYKYHEYTVKNASEMVYVTEAIGYEWQRRWNEDRYNGLWSRT